MVCVTHPLPAGPLVDVAPPRKLISGTVFTARAIWAHRDLLKLLVRRDLTSRYKDSALGFLWSLVRPLTLLLIYYVAIGKFLSAERSIPMFAIYIFTGLTAWTFFSELITGMTNSIIANAGLIKKVYVPRELFPLAALGSALFNFAVQFVVLIGATIALGQFPLTLEILYVPAAFLVLMLFAIALGLVLAAANVYLRDIQHLVDVALVVLFWASPIVYSYDAVHQILQGNWVEHLYLLNPVTVVVIAFQKGLWVAGSTNPALEWPPDLALRLLITGLVSLALLWFAQRVFARLEGNFAQEM
jgi:ABC-2 type transport system permease protein